MIYHEIKSKANKLFNRLTNNVIVYIISVLILFGGVLLYIGDRNEFNNERDDISQSSIGDPTDQQFEIIEEQRRIDERFGFTEELNVKISNRLTTSESAIISSTKGVTELSTSFDKIEKTLSDIRSRGYISNSCYNPNIGGSK